MSYYRLTALFRNRAETLSIWNRNLFPKAESMEALQAHFLNQLQQMGSKYYKVLPVNFDEISAKKVKYHLVVVNGDSSSFKNTDKKLVTLVKYIGSAVVSIL